MPRQWSSGHDELPTVLLSYIISPWVQSAGYNHVITPDTLCNQHNQLNKKIIFQYSMAWLQFLELYTLWETSIRNYVHCLLQSGVLHWKQKANCITGGQQLISIVANFPITYSSWTSLYRISLYNSARCTVPGGMVQIYTYLRSQSSIRLV